MNYYLVNTNEKYDPGATEYNLLKQEVIVYGSLKESINKFNKGDGIFLYKKEVGIIAFGLRGASVGFDRIFWGWVAVATLGAIMSNFSEEWME